MENGVAVSERTGVWVAVDIKVIGKEAGVNIVSSLNLELQPVYKRIKTVKITLENRMDTALSCGDRIDLNTRVLIDQF